jgi:hypothetical protein
MKGMTPMNASTPSTENRTAEQVTKFNRRFEDYMKQVRELVLKKVDPDKDGLQLLLENFDEYAGPITDLAIDRAREMTTPNQFSDEEAESSYEYPKEYKGARPIKEQVAKLAELFSVSSDDALKFAESLPATLPNGAEGWFAILSPAALEKLFPNEQDPAERYCKAVSLTIEKLAASRKFYNYRENQITPKRLRQHARTIAALAKIAESQKGDILIIPAQLGLRHRGRSVRRARVCFKTGEYGLRSLDVGCIALTHPERFVRYEELDTDCAGDDFAPDAGGDFDGAPCFDFFVGVRLEFGARYVDFASARMGSASGFPPQ